jgi:hypothetical protein
MMLLVAPVVIADLCSSAPLAVTARDPVESATYGDVGDEARALDDARTAAIAYRSAMALDPANTHARDALAALCQIGAADADAAANDALLAAIAAYRAGEFEAAVARFATIAARGGASAAGAHLFLGLIALRRHDGGGAVTELEAARHDPAYAELATSMLRLAHRDGAFSAILITENEVDTNPQLLPDTPPAGATTGPRQADDNLLILATVTARPWRWLSVRDVLSWRKQVTLTSLDFLGETAQLGLELGEGNDHLTIRYDLDDDLLDGHGYLLASRGTVAIHHDLAAVTLGASYALRRRDYQQLAEAPFSGWVHSADASAVLRLTPRFDVEARAFGWRELAADPVFANLTGGLQLATRASLGGRTRLAATATVWSSRYDAAEPNGTLREDAHGEASMDVEVDLGDHVFAVGGASVLGNRSTVEDFRYWKLVARCGIAIAFGGP